MKFLTIALLVLSFNIQAKELSQCELKIIESVKSELSDSNTIPDPSLVKDEADHIKYLGDGMFEVYFPVVPRGDVEQSPTHTTWEIAIGAECKITYQTVIESYI